MDLDKYSNYCLNDQIYNLDKCWKERKKLPKYQFFAPYYHWLGIENQKEFNDKYTDEAKRILSSINWEQRYNKQIGKLIKPKTSYKDPDTKEEKVEYGEPYYPDLLNARRDINIKLSYIKSLELQFRGHMLKQRRAEMRGSLLNYCILHDIDGILLKEYPKVIMDATPGVGKNLNHSPKVLPNLDWYKLNVCRHMVRANMAKIILGFYYDSEIFMKYEPNPVKKIFERKFRVYQENNDGKSWGKDITHEEHFTLLKDYNNAKEEMHKPGGNVLRKGITVYRLEDKIQEYENKFLNQNIYQGRTDKDIVYDTLLEVRIFSSGIEVPKLSVFQAKSIVNFYLRECGKEKKKFNELRKKLSNKKPISTADKIAYYLYKAGNKKFIASLCSNELGVAPSTVYRNLKKAKKIAAEIRKNPENFFHLKLSNDK